MVRVGSGSVCQACIWFYTCLFIKLHLYLHAFVYCECLCAISTENHPSYSCNDEVFVMVYHAMYSYDCNNILYLFQTQVEKELLGTGGNGISRAGSFSI